MTATTGDALSHVRLVVNSGSSFQGNSDRNPVGRPDEIDAGRRPPGDSFRLKMHGRMYRLQERLELVRHSVIALLAESSSQQTMTLFASTSK